MKINFLQSKSEIVWYYSLWAQHLAYSNKTQGQGIIRCYVFVSFRVQDRIHNICFCVWALKDNLPYTTSHKHTHTVWIPSRFLCTNADPNKKSSHNSARIHIYNTTHSCSGLQERLHHCLQHSRLHDYISSLKWKRAVTFCFISEFPLSFTFLLIAFASFYIGGLDQKHTRMCTSCIDCCEAILKTHFMPQ